MGEDTIEQGPPERAEPRPSPRSPNWRQVLGLAALGILPSVYLVVVLPEIPAVAVGQPVVLIALTALISVVWIAVAVSSRMRRPILTLVGVGLLGEVLSILATVAYVMVRGFLTAPIFLAALMPLGEPLGIVRDLAHGAAHGAVCGLLAWGVRWLRERGERGSGDAAPEAPQTSSH